MAIISNGTIEINLTQAGEEDKFNIEKSTRRTAGGRLKTQTNRGRRYFTILKARVTGSVYESLLDMLHDQSAAYYFTPTKTTNPTNSGYTFPLEVNIDIKAVPYDSGDVYHIELEIEGVDPY